MGGKSGKTNLKQASDLLKTLPAKDASSFVASLMAEDPAVVDRFLRRFGHFDYTRERDELLGDLREAEYEHSEYHGFIDWRHTVAFETAIQKIVDTRIGDVLAREDYESALSLGFEVYRFLTDVDMDGTSASDGDLLVVLDDTWDAIFKTGHKRGDDMLLGLLFDRLNSYTQDSDFLEETQSDVSDWIYDKQCEHIKEYLLQRYCVLPAHASAMQALVDEELSSANASSCGRRAVVGSRTLQSVRSHKQTRGKAIGQAQPLHEKNRALGLGSGALHGGDRSVLRRADHIRQGLPIRAGRVSLFCRRGKAGGRLYRSAAAR